MVVGLHGGALDDHVLSKEGEPLLAHELAEVALLEIEVGGGEVVEDEMHPIL